MKAYGSWALVAGASEGLGAAFATSLAQRKYNLVLLARRPAPLEALAQDLRATHSIEVVTRAMDLGAPDVLAQVAPLVEGREVGVYVHNAAYSGIGDFTELPRERSLQSLDVSCRAALEILHLLLPAMRRRSRGAVVLMSSLTAFQGSPYASVYGATKAFHLALAEGLWAELRPYGVDVLACCAGATRTPGYLKSMPNGAPGELEPAAVAEEALDALGKGPMRIPGRFNRFASLFMRRLLPRRTAISIMGAQTQKLKAIE